MNGPSAIHLPQERLRLWAVSVLRHAGLSPSQATEFARHLFWFDAAGDPTRGIVALPDWHGRLARGEYNVHAEFAFARERAATLTIDAKQAIPPLALGRAVAMAADKAREVGLAAIRLRNLRGTADATPALADLALEPRIALARSPEGRIAAALPVPQGLPILLEWKGEETPPLLFDPLMPVFWAGLVASGEWLIAAWNVQAWESLDEYTLRIGAALEHLPPGPGRFLPADQEAGRGRIEREGIAIAPDDYKRLRAFAESLKIALPERIAR